MASAVGHVVGEYLTSSDALNSAISRDLTYEEFENQAIAIAKAVGGATVLLTQDGVSQEELNRATAMSESVVKNNSFTKIGKVGYKALKKLKQTYDKKGKISFDDLKSNLKEVGTEEALSIIEDVIELTDGKWTVDDLFSGVDLVVGIDLKSKEGKAKVAKEAKKIYGEVFGKKGLDKYSVGEYKDLKGKVKGLDAHHVGQKAVLKKHIKDYDEKTAPSILVPKKGHTEVKPKLGVVSRKTNIEIKNPNTKKPARSVIARDVQELKRVYPDIPNPKLQELIKMNKTKYPEVRK